MSIFTKKGNSKGFTLIELLVVIAIIGMLAAIVLASLNTARLKSRDAKRVADLKQVQLALELYADSHSQKYPATLTGNLDAANCSGTAKCMPSMPKDPLDGSTYFYGYTSADPFTTYTLGALLEESTNPALQSKTSVGTAGVLGYTGSAGGTVTCSVTAAYCISP